MSFMVYFFTLCIYIFTQYIHVYVHVYTTQYGRKVSLGLLLGECCEIVTSYGPSCDKKRKFSTLLFFVCEKKKRWERNTVKLEGTKKRAGRSWVDLREVYPSLSGVISSHEK